MTHEHKPKWDSEVNSRTKESPADGREFVWQRTIVEMCECGARRRMVEERDAPNDDFERRASARATREPATWR